MRLTLDLDLSESTKCEVVFNRKDLYGYTEFAFTMKGSEWTRASRPTKIDIFIDQLEDAR